MAETILNGILLSNKTYIPEPNHSLIEVLTPKGKFSMIAQGVNKPISKNANQLQIGSIAEYEFFQARLNNKVSKLKKVNIIKQVDTTEIDNLVLVDKIVEYIKKIDSHFKIVYSLYLKILAFIDRNKNSHLLTYFIANTLKCYGLQFSTNKCVLCKTINEICFFSFSDGGFLCQNCSDNQYDVEILKSFYYLFNDLESYLHICNDENNIFVQKLLISYLKKQGINF